MLELNKIYQGDCLIKLKELEDNSVDSIVTDPPYELGFMGKSWDNTGIANNKEMWKECLRVLKPGGHLLAFSGTRTYHRMASAIEDAGFEVRDMIEWVYGCLSEDTEILTINGWEHYNKTKRLNSNIPILIYDVENNFYKWEKPKRWSEYNINKDTCYRIKSDTTDQLVSRNHNCLVEREGKLIFIKAEELQEVEYMPILSDNFSILSERQRELLQSSMLWKSKNLVEELFSKWFGQEMSEQRNENGKESCLERRSDLLQEERQLWEIQNKICEMSRTIYQYGEKGWLCNGTPIDNGETYKEMSFENRSDTSQRPQSREQQDRELNSIQEQQGTQNLRGYGITKAKVTKEEYSGIIFCPTVSTGAFVARRNGQVFITGNSGFPKSHNIGKAVDKLQGNERIPYERPDFVARSNKTPQRESQVICGEKGKYTKGTSEWEGWGTALKPAHEPICMARKPLSEKTVAENVLKWGTGGINIDESRVGNTTETHSKSSESAKGKGIFGEYGEVKTEIKDYGRFPANLIHDGSKEVRECFPETKSKGHFPSNNKNGNSIFNTNNLEQEEQWLDGSGNASRFFKSIIYQAKASKSERNKGCDKLEEKETPYGSGGGAMPSGNDNPNKTTSRNNHPTVKPLKLMEYLIKMVTPKGGIVLDPFAGSGTTGVACKNLNRNYILIEKEPEYVKIANERIKQQLTNSEGDKE